MPGERYPALITTDRELTIRVVPKRDSKHRPTDFGTFRISPGLNLIEAVARMAGATREELLLPKFAAQGRSIETLLAQFQEVSESGLWTPIQSDITPHLRWIQNCLSKNATVQDVVCSILAYLAKQSATVIERDLPRFVPISEILLCGALQNHGGFIQQLRMRLPSHQILAVNEVHVEQSLASPAAAIMALARIDQVIGNSYQATGAKTSRCLGQITPGTPKNWEKLVAEMYQQLPSTLSLKEAV